MIRIGIIEDNIFLLKSFRDYLNSTEGMAVVFSCASMEEAKEALGKWKQENPGYSRTNEDYKELKEEI